MKRRDKERVRQLHHTWFVQVSISNRSQGKKMARQAARNCLRLQRLAKRHGIELPDQFPCGDMAIFPCSACAEKTALL